MIHLVLKSSVFLILPFLFLQVAHADFCTHFMLDNAADAQAKTDTAMGEKLLEMIERTCPEPDPEHAKIYDFECHDDNGKTVSHRYQGDLTCTGTLCCEEKASPSPSPTVTPTPISTPEEEAFSVSCTPWGFVYCVVVSTGGAFVDGLNGVPPWDSDFVTEIGINNGCFDRDSLSHDVSWWIAQTTGHSQVTGLADGLGLICRYVTFKPLWE